MSIAKENYALFLESDFWKQIRVECFRRDGWICRHCGIGSEGRLQAHHVLYPDDWYQTTIDHLITLCSKCHERTHGINKPIQKLRPHKKIKNGFKWYAGMYEGKTIEPKPTKPPISRHQQIRGLRSRLLISRKQFEELLKNPTMPLPQIALPVSSKNKIHLLYGQRKMILV